MNDTSFVQNYREVRLRLNKGIPATGVPVVVIKPPEPLPKAPEATLEEAISNRRLLMDGCPLPNRLKLSVLCVLEEANISWNSLFNSSRKRPLTRIRWKVFSALREEGLSLLQIARHCGMDHSTVLHGIRETLKSEKDNSHGTN